jgi:hypothetical protein
VRQSLHRSGEIKRNALIRSSAFLYCAGRRLRLPHLGQAKGIF